MIGIFSRYYMVFLPRRETGVIQFLLYIGWTALLLLSTAFGLQNIHNNGILTPSWIIVGGSLPVILHWLYETWSKPKINLKLNGMERSLDSIRNPGLVINYVLIGEPTNFTHVGQIHTGNEMDHRPTGWMTGFSPTLINSYTLHIMHLSWRCFANLIPTWWISFWTILALNFKGAYLTLCLIGGFLILIDL
jgi:hypothetical protein